MQLLDHGDIISVVEELINSFRRDFPDAINGSQSFPVQICNAPNTSVPLSQFLANRAAYTEDAERLEQSIDIPVLGVFNRLQEVIRFLCTELFQREHFIPVIFQSIDVRECSKPAALNKRIYDSRAHTTDIHAVTRADELELFRKLSRTVGIWTECTSFILAILISTSNELTATRRASTLEHIKNAVGLLVCDTNDFRNDFCSLPNQNCIADVDVQLLDDFRIMQGSLGDGSSAELNRRIEQGDGCHPASPSSLEEDVGDGCLLLFRRILERNGPTWILCGIAKPLSQFEIIDFHHCTVDPVGQAASAFTNRFDSLMDTVFHDERSIDDIEAKVA